ncbi:hypothetical protein MJG53_000072 [Ovis ammon polii x Ovis aries]|nr:hypothetical protein MJG53_000072 [Ovis ammon polii x Ovis aries]
MYPKIHVSTGEESSGSGPHSTQGLRPRHRRERNTEKPPRNWHGDWPFLRPPERVRDVPVKYRKIHVSTGEESSGSGPDSTQVLRPRHRRERNPERPPRNSHGDRPFLRTPELVPEGPVPRIDSHHVCTWDSPVGKPGGKDSRENHRSFAPRGGQRDTAATALEESTSACPHSRRGLTPLGRLQKYPKIHVSTGEESSGSGPDSTQGLRPRHRRERNPERPPRNSHGNRPFLRPPERVPEVPVKYPKIHVSTGEESSGSGPDSTQGLRPRHRRERNPERPPRNSDGDWPFLRPPERVPEVPVKYRKIHVSTGEESSGSGPDSTQGLSPRHRRERNPERPPRNSHGDWPFLRTPELVPEGPVPRIDSHHVCTWDSPVGKPGGKESREQHRSFDPRGGLRDTAATALKESASACPHSRRGLTPLGRLQKYPKIHVSTGEESSGSGPDSTQGLRPRHRRERNPKRPPRNSNGDWPFLRPPERVPEVPVVSREHLPHLEKIQEVLPSRRDEAHFR